jgi:hypothetical protein
MTEQHHPEMLQKMGHEWTNDLGQRFPATLLFRCECSCGWRGAAWYTSKDRALGFYERHLQTTLATSGI